jgi:hypothetical protein
MTSYSAQKHDIHLSKLAGQLAGVNWRWFAMC